MVANVSQHPQLSLAIAEAILQGFDKHFTIFQEYTTGAKKRFENADWKSEHSASRERILLYDKRVDEAIQGLKEKFRLDAFGESL